jgi:hypothetical protein
MQSINGLSFGFRDVLQGYNGTIFAYGQTGAGKTFTMFGPDLVSSDVRGIIPRACSYTIYLLQKKREREREGERERGREGEREKGRKENSHIPKNKQKKSAQSKKAELKSIFFFEFFREIFEYINNDKEGTEFTIKCSFLEIYKEVIHDLLNPEKENLRVRETPSRGVWVDNLTEEVTFYEKTTKSIFQFTMFSLNHYNNHTTRFSYWFIIIIIFSL